VREGRVIDAGFDGSMIELIKAWPAVREGLETAALSGVGQPMSETALLAPVPRPGKVFAIGLNYADHIEESKAATPEHQVWFTKAVTSVNGPYAAVQIPKASPYVDYEVRIPLIVGAHST
jgi:2-keto-4-pentenoate hydratase/2-oxohepta-3-ene-1,7-dioic acid hydratase in catechol pathway